MLTEWQVGWLLSQSPLTHVKFMAISENIEALEGLTDGIRHFGIEEWDNRQVEFVRPAWQLALS